MKNDEVAAEPRAGRTWTVRYMRFPTCPMFHPADVIEVLTQSGPGDEITVVQVPPTDGVFDQCFAGIWESGFDLLKGAKLTAERGDFPLAGEMMSLAMTLVVRATQNTETFLEMYDAVMMAITLEKMDRHAG